MKENLINLNGVEVDIWMFLLSFVPLLLMFFAFIGISYKFYTILVSILSYPTYIALFQIEDMFLKKKDLRNKKFFRVHIPKNIRKKIWMNSFASMVTIIVLTILLKYIMYFEIIINKIIQKTDDINAIIIKGFIVDSTLVYVILGSIAIIYLLSWFEEVQEKTGMGKILDLNIPSLWKSVIKKDD